MGLTGRTLSFVSGKLRKTALKRVRWVTGLQDTIFQAVYGHQPAIVDGKVFHLDPRDIVTRKRMTLYGSTERFELRTALDRLGPGSRFVDVGANIGLYSVFASERVGREGEVVAIEPDPDNVSFLRRNLAENGCSNVRVMSVAMSDHIGTVRLYQNERSRGELSLADQTGSGDWIGVSSLTLDKTLDGKIANVLKIDVEGAEPLVLAGATATLEQYPVVFVEINAPMLRKFGFNPKDVISFFDEDSYRFFFLDEDHEQTVQMKPESIIEKATTHYREINVLCDPQSV